MQLILCGARLVRVKVIKSLERFCVQFLLASMIAHFLLFRYGLLILFIKVGEHIISCLVFRFAKISNVARGAEASLLGLIHNTLEYGITLQTIESGLTSIVIDVVKDCSVLGEGLLVRVLFLLLLFLRLFFGLLEILHLRLVLFG